MTPIDIVYFSDVYCTDAEHARSKIGEAVRKAYSDTLPDYTIPELTLNPVYNMGGQLVHFEFDAVVNVYIEL